MQHPGNDAHPPPAGEERRPMQPKPFTDGSIVEKFHEVANTSSSGRPQNKDPRIKTVQRSIEGAKEVLIVDYPNDESAWHEIRPWSDLWTLGLTTKVIRELMEGGLVTFR
jgi:hypothetical protein